MSNLLLASLGLDRQVGAEMLALRRLENATRGGRP